MSRFPPKLQRKYGSFTNVMGKGSFGTVYQTSKGFAVKRIEDPGYISDSGIQEAALMQLVDNEYCMRALDVGIDRREIYIVMELGEGIPDVDLPKDQLPEVFRDVCLGIAGLHSFDVLHLDLKPANCLRIGNQVKLTDFGISRFQTCVRKDRDTVYTIFWRPPEILLDFPATRASDVWAAGIMLVTWLLGEIPFNSTDPKELLQMIFEEFGTPTEVNWPGVTNSRKYPEKMVEASYELLKDIEDPVARDLVGKMLEVNPHRRPTIFEVLQHPFFAEVPVDVNLDPPGCRDNLELNVLDSELTREPRIRTSRYLKTVRIANSERKRLGISGMGYGLSIPLFNWCIRHLKVPKPNLTMLACLNLGSSMFDRMSPNTDQWLFRPDEMLDEIERILRAREFRLAFTSALSVAMFRAQFQSDPGIFSVLESVSEVMLMTTLPWELGTVELGDLMFDMAWGIRNNRSLGPIETTFLPIRDPGLREIQKQILMDEGWTSTR